MANKALLAINEKIYGTFGRVIKQYIGKTNKPLHSPRINAALKNLIKP